MDLEEVRQNDTITRTWCLTTLTLMRDQDRISQRKTRYDTIKTVTA